MPKEHFVAQGDTVADHLCIHHIDRDLVGHR